MKTLTKALVGTVAAGAMAVAAASPAHARDGIGAGEIIAGALIIGGIAAIAAASDNDKADYGYRGDRYGYGRGDSRSAVDMCVRSAQSAANRYSYGRARVTDIRNIDRKRDGYNVKGRIVVDDRGRDWRRSRGYDSGSFTCKVRYGRVVDIDFKNIRGL